eukprot:gene13765-4024_t
MSVASVGNTVIANITLVHLELSSQGLTDDVMHELVEILIDHPNIRTTNFQDNLDVTTPSGRDLLRLIRTNHNIVEVKVERTGMGKNVISKVNEACAQNMTR